MKQVINPAELEWFSNPLPSPETVHPDCRIVVWQNQYDLEKATIHVVSSKTFHISQDRKTNYYWVTADGKTWVDKNQHVSWAWWKSFQ